MFCIIDHFSFNIQKIIVCLQIIELETADESIEKLKERISTLQNENTDLRDRNDELTTQLESASSRTCHRRYIF